MSTKIQRVLVATSPMLHGEDVKAAQFLLSHNRWDQNFHPGPVDGFFGESTAKACKRAKYYLGYRRSECRSFFGPDLQALLVPVADQLHTTLSPLQKIRHNRRVKAAVIGWRKGSVIEARKNIGYKESPPGSNHTKFNIEYYGSDIAAPWCAIFVTHCRNVAGDKTWHYAFVPTVLALARAHQARMMVVGAPEMGDLVCFDWDKDGTPDHIELFEAWVKTGSTFNTIGGNTGATDRSNGGEVLRSVRNISDVEGFVRVNRV